MKRTFFALLSSFCLLLCSCDVTEKNKEKSDLTERFRIEANSSVYYLDNTDTKQIKITIASDSILNEHKKEKLTMYSDVNTCGGEFVRSSGEDAYYFVAHEPGNAVIKAKYGDLESSNSIAITARKSDESLAEILENVLDTTGGVVLGQEYDIGISTSDASNYRIEGANGILRINDKGKLDVCGIGQGKLKLLKGTSVVFDGRYTVYNSVLATKIKEDLISQGRIENKASLVTNDLLAFVKSMNLNGELINDPTASFGVKYLNNLETLDLSNNNLSDASFISSISTLKKLNLANNAFSDISSIVENENLEYLDLSNNSLSAITKLQFLYKIKELDLSDNRITDISPLSSSYSLRSLKLNNNKIQNFKDSLSGLEDLTELFVGNCDIPFTDIISLRYLPNITSLDVSGSNPTLENLAQLTKLTKLIIQDCNLSNKSLAPLNLLANLEYLDISNNDIDAEAYGSGLNSASLNKIETLLMGGNAFDSIPDLSGFANIKKLDLSYSYNLTTLSSLSGLPIEELILDNSNSINAESLLSLLASLSSLEKISVVGGFNYIDEALYNHLVEEVENGNLKLRFLDRDYIDNKTISNYKKSVIFSMSSFLELCTAKDDGYVVPDLGEVRHLILSLVNDTGTVATSPYKILINSTLARLDIFGNLYTTYDLMFSVNDRKESSFTFGFHNFRDAVSVNESLITAAAGSKLILTGDGVSELYGTAVEDNPAPIISCYDINLKYPDYPNSSLSIRGFAGVKGTNGKNADTSDMGVKNGKNGKTGGTAIKCHYITARKTSAEIYGGTGGDGGDGGNSNAGFLAIGDWRQGGKGGTGGTGGVGVQCQKYELLDSTIVHGGEGGDGGRGGKGLDGRAKDGSGGNTGQAILLG